ncbi:unnamed protein product [Gulo gulo]|uniref:Uncharacterized protein n=1 Tax=Gulo gulo TaxID=48420 RepID=A0A9X9LGF1_GULGU|nr:unnamed protein product [Gulo gulo]
MTMTHRGARIGRKRVSRGDREDQGCSLEERAPQLGTEDTSVLTASLICHVRSGIWGPADPGGTGHAWRRWRTLLGAASTGRPAHMEPHCSLGRRSPPS